MRLSRRLGLGCYDRRCRGWRRGCLGFDRYRLGFVLLFFDGLLFDRFWSSGAALLEFEEAAQGAVVIALESGFELIDGFQGGAFEDVAGHGVGDLVEGCARFIGDAAGEGGGFGLAEAVDAPFGVDHGPDLVRFGRAERGEFLEIAIAELVIFVQ